MTRQVVYNKIRMMVLDNRHLRSRTYDYGHNDMQTDTFCVFCHANQAKYITRSYRTDQIKIKHQWHRKDCVAVIILKEEK